VRGTQRARNRDIRNVCTRVYYSTLVGTAYQPAPFELPVANGLRLHHSRLYLLSPSPTSHRATFWRSYIKQVRAFARTKLAAQSISLNSDNPTQAHAGNASQDININALRAQVEGTRRLKIDSWCSSNKLINYRNPMPLPRSGHSRKRRQRRGNNRRPLHWYHENFRTRPVSSRLQPQQLPQSSGHAHRKRPLLSFPNLDPLYAGALGVVTATGTLWTRLHCKRFSEGRTIKE